MRSLLIALLLTSCASAPAISLSVEAVSATSGRATLEADGTVRFRVALCLARAGWDAGDERAVTRAELTDLSASGLDAGALRSQILLLAETPAPECVGRRFAAEARVPSSPGASLRVHVAAGGTTDTTEVTVEDP